MNQHYVVVEFAHSIRGRLKRISISVRSLGYVFSLLVLISLGAGALFSSYLRMSWKASQYEMLQQNFDHLRMRYAELQRVASQRKDQIASLQSLAAEISARYGIVPPASEFPDRAQDAAARPSVRDTIQEYSFLRSATVSEIYHQYAFQWQTHNQPSLWPVAGTLRSAFGGRPDPFSGEGEFHTGIDISAPKGTPVHVTADGVVETADWSGSYGKLIVVNHGNGIETYYAHLSQMLVLPGEEVRAGQVIALSGGTGRVTAPHLHYEVRISGTPVNPWRYLGHPQTARLRKTHNDLGL
jgi:murein DD-endopeptidase MepM/ murein hydrolase activator NlpD